MITDGLIMLEIVNAGAEIKSTNYFDTAHALRGLYYVSWNASSARVLVPDVQLGALDEMRTGRICVISRGKLYGVDALELMFDDGSDAPFALHIEMRQTDRAIIDDHQSFKVAAWTRAGKVAEWSGKYRVVQELPYLEPWIEH